MKKINANFKIKALDETGTFEGYGSVFGVRDDHNDIVEKGAFLDSIAAHKARGAMPKMLAFHDFTKIAGTYTDMGEDEHGLWLKGQYLLSTQLGREQYELAKAGAIDGLSIGFTLPDGGEEWDDDARANRIKKIDLWEVSLVPFPANDAARVTAVKAGQVPDIRTTEKALRDAGWSHKQAKALLAEGYKATSLRDAADEAAEHANKLHKHVRSLRNG